MSQNLNLRRRWTAPVLCGLLAGLYPLASAWAQTAPSSVNGEVPTSADPEPLPQEAEPAPEADAAAIAEGHELSELTLTVYPIEFAPGELPLAEPAVRVGSFNIVIVPGPTLAGNAAALAAFNRAAAAWESFFSDPITVTINADLANLGGGGVIGSTDSVALEVTAPYTDLRTVWVASADGDDDILSFLPTAANRAFSVNTGYSLSTTTLGLKATLKAMGGFGDLDGDLGATDATITFNTQFAFDYDNSNGVGVGLTDFETTAAHEIGHALGFFSSADIVDERIHNGQPAIAIYPSLLDYLRFLDGSASDPATALNFSTFVRELQTSQNAITDFIFAVASEGVQNRMSTGKWTGDGRQASHWKDNELTGTRLGIMDPTLPVQQVWTISHADVRALDLIGYDVVLDDCNNNGFDDNDDITAGTSADCNANGNPDECDIAAGVPDCNRNGTPDACELAGNDCNANGTPDECDTLILNQSNTSGGPFGATNMPGTQNYQTFQPSLPSLGGVSIGIIHANAVAPSSTVSVEVRRGTTVIASASQVVSAGFNGLRYFELPTTPVVPGETLILAAREPLNMFHWQYGSDTYPNGQRFFNAVAQPGTDWVFQTYATAGDCNRDLVPDTCQLAGNDCNGNAVPDDCEPDCNANGVADACDLLFPDHNCCATGHGAGCSDPGIQACVCALDPYCCNNTWDSICTAEVQSLGCGSCGPASDDCNANGIPDECDGCVPAALLTWDFENATSAGNISTAVGVSGHPAITGFASQTGGGPAEYLGPTYGVTHLTRALGTVHPFIEFTLSCPLVLNDVTFQHLHNHNPGYPTNPSYDVQLQIDTGSGYADVGTPLNLSAANSGQTDSMSLNVSLGPGTYRIRWDARNLAFGGDTSSEFFALNNLVVNGTHGGCVPATTVTGAVARKANPSGSGGNCDLPLLPARKSEPRSGGVTEVRVTFNAPPGGPGASPVTIQQATCAAPAFAPYTGAAVASAGVAGNDLVLNFSPALENGRTYKLNIGASVTAIAGQSVEVRGLVGDVNSDGQVNALDRSVVVGTWTGAGSFSCPTDVNSSGQTNALDRSVVVGAWTGAQNCAP